MSWLPYPDPARARETKRLRVQARLSVSLSPENIQKLLQQGAVICAYEKDLEALSQSALGGCGCPGFCRYHTVIGGSSLPRPEAER